MQSEGELAELLLCRRDGPQGGARCRSLQQLASQPGKGKVELPHSRTLQLRRSETEMQLRRQLLYLVRGGVPHSGGARWRGRRCVIRPAFRAKCQRARESHGGYRCHRALTPAEPPAPASGERETIDPPCYIAALYNRDRCIRLAELKSRRQPVVQLEIEIGRSCGLERPWPTHNAKRHAGQDPKNGDQNRRRHGEPKRSDMVGEQDAGSDERTRSEAEQRTASHTPESDGVGYRRECSRDVEALAPDASRVRIRDGR